MSTLRLPPWHSPGHRLWDDFCRAMIPAQLMEDDWIRYQEVHDPQESPEVMAAIDRVSELLKSDTEPLPGPLREPKKFRPRRLPRPKRA